MLKDMVLLVSSCDKYKALWKPFFTLLNKYWSDCPFEVYLLSENPNYPGVKGISGEDKGFSSNIKRALDKIKESYILFMTEDSFLTAKVDTKRVLGLFEIMKKDNIRHLGLTPFLHPVNFPQFKNYPDLIEVWKDPYRVNFQAGIWEKEVLDKILVEGENPWETELKGADRSFEFKPFTMMKNEFILKYIQGSVKGRMPDETIEHLRGERFNFPIETIFE